MSDMQEMLPAWYESGRATYTYANCEAYDMIAPIRYRAGSTGKFEFCPLLISVKNRLQFSPKERKSALQAMKKALEKAGLKVGVCMLLLVGLEEGPKETPGGAGVGVGDSKTSLFREDSITSFVVVVPPDDPFGVSAFVEDASIGGGQSSEVYASHAELAIHPSVPTEKLLRKKTSQKSDSYQLLNEVRKKYESLA